jgi:hypothetical protein
MSDEVFEQPTVVVDPPVETTAGFVSAPPPPLAGGVEVTTTTVNPQSTLPPGVTVSVMPNGDVAHSGCVIVVECDDPRFDVVTTVAEVGTAPTLPVTGPEVGPFLFAGAVILAAGLGCRRLQRRPRLA